MNLNLFDISINQLVAEMTLRNLLSDRVQGLIALFKITPMRLESTFLWNGNFYTSNYERIPEFFRFGDTFDFIFTKIKAKSKQMENLFEQLTQTQVSVNQIFLYGENIEDKLIQFIQQNMTANILRLNPLQNIRQSENFQNRSPALDDMTNYVESIGVVLDQ
jgi:hypothetical protein